MIVNVRGSHGTGKSTIVRAIMATYRRIKPIYLETGRRIPIGYVCEHKGRRPLFVCGSYQHPTGGGCDTVPGADLIYKFVRRYAKKDMDVLFEGIVAQHSTPNAMRLHDHHDLRIVLIRIGVKRALHSVKKRRAARGDARPFNPANTIKEYSHRSVTPMRIRGDGLKLYVCKTRRKALASTLTLLGIE
jgi:hypothetical protein